MVRAQNATASTERGQLFDICGANIADLISGSQGGNDNKLACALADSCVDLLGRAVRTLSDDEWCLLNVDVG